VGDAAVLTGVTDQPLAENHRLHAHVKQPDLRDDAAALAADVAYRDRINTEVCVSLERHRCLVVSAYLPVDGVVGKVEVARQL